MYCPLVRERVWVSGCTHEFVVMHADYSTCVATISPVELKSQERKCRFRELFAYAEFAKSQAVRSVKNDVADALGSSRLCIEVSTRVLRDLRDTTEMTHTMISKSRELIGQTDQVIARWRTLGCKS